MYCYQNNNNTNIIHKNEKWVTNKKVKFILK